MAMTGTSHVPHLPFAVDVASLCDVCGTAIWAAVVQQGAEASVVEMATLSGRPSTWLNGFKARPLKATEAA
eukprot:3031567-Prymnesium_polylepis.1